MKLPDGWIFILKMKDKLTIELEERELITCGNCKYNDYGFCNEIMDGESVRDDWFCASGEKREEEGE